MAVEKKIWFMLKIVLFTALCLLIVPKKEMVKAENKVDWEHYYVYSSDKELNKYAKKWDDFYLDQCVAMEPDQNGFYITNGICLEYDEPRNYDEEDWEEEDNKIKSVKIPDGVTKVYGLEGYNIRLVIPATVEEIRNVSAESVYFEKRNGKPLKIGCHCFESTLIENFPPEVIEIGRDSFFQADFENLTLPDTITEIPEKTFCSTQGRIRLPESVKKIGKNSFDGTDTGLDGSYVIVPNSVKTIGKGAFHNQKGKVICKKGSAIEKYCKKNHIDYTHSGTPRFEKKTYYIVKGYYDYFYFQPMGIPGKVHISIKDKKIAGYDGDQYVYNGKKIGKTTIIATLNGKKYTAKLVVLPKSKQNRIKEAVHNSVDSSMSDAKKADMLAGWLMGAYEYGSDPHQKYSCTSSEGALLDGYAVCSGVAAAYQELLEHAGIKCKVVRGTTYNGIQWASHAWNLVKTEDGWTHMDVTFRGMGAWLSSDKEISGKYKWDHKKYPKAKKSYHEL